MNNFIY